MSRVAAAAFLSGALFGAGLAIASMTDRQVVLGFLDVAGAWNPTLVFVMGGAVAVTAVAFRLVLKRPRPALGGEFRAPDGTVAVDDTLALLAKFGAAAGAPIKARAELLGVGGGGPVAAIDGKITVSDLLAVLAAFAGGSYPFTP